MILYPPHQDDNRPKTPIHFVDVIDQNEIDKKLQRGWHTSLNKSLGLEPIEIKAPEKPIELPKVEEEKPIVNVETKRRGRPPKVG